MDADLMAEQVHGEMDVEDLQSQLEDALVRCENAEERSDVADDLEAALFRIAKYAGEKYGCWSEDVARKVLRLHALKTPPERE